MVGKMPLKLVNMFAAMADTGLIIDHDGIFSISS